MTLATPLIAAEQSSDAATLTALMDPNESAAIARFFRRQGDTIVARAIPRHRSYPLMAASAEEYFEGDWNLYRHRYLRPMIELLERGFANQDKRFFYVYRAQRLRYFLPAMRASGGQAELDQLLVDELQTIMDCAEEAGLADPARQTLQHMVAALHQPLMGEGPQRTLKLALIGDCALSEINTFAVPMIDDCDVRLSTYHYYFSAGSGRDLPVDEITAAIEDVNFDLMVMSFLTYEGLPLYTSLLREASGNFDKSSIDQKCDVILNLVDRYIASVRALTPAPILLHGCSGLPLTKVRRYLPFLPAMSSGQRYVVQYLDNGLRQIGSGVENLIFIDEARLVAGIGHRSADKRLMPRRFRYKPLFHPSQFGPLIASEYASVARAYLALAKTKVLLIDFDNTLWRGVMADGPVEHDVSGQKLLRELKEAGVLLVSMSKNDPKNIRWDEMVLKQDDFVLHRISWDSKAKSVIEVAQQLDLDPSSFVLIDDNPVERELVTSAAPGVTALDPTEPETWRHLAWLLDFPATRQTEESKRRTEMYREAAQRREAQSANLDYPTMMRSLELKVGWRLAKASDLDRLNELVNRTNQFNTTTIRYSQSELANLIKDPEYRVFVATLTDKFGALGIVGTSICKITADRIEFVNVVMSCRAMGFGLESILVRGPIDDLPGRKEAIGCYIPTQRNNPCADLFAKSGFQRLSEAEWQLDLQGTLPAAPDWFQIDR